MTPVIAFTPKGREITFHEPFTHADLVDMDDLIDAMDALPEPDEMEDPDSDGYGWERRALSRIC